MISFAKANEVSQIKKAFLYICKENRPKQAQIILANLKNNSNFCLLLSIFLASSHQQEINQKILAALQLKNMTVIQQRQCWEILMRVYINDNEKLSQIVKDICLREQHIKYLEPFLKQNFEGKNSMQQIRILQLFFSIIFNKNEQIAKQFVKLYSYDILNCLINIDSRQIEFQIVAELIMLALFGLYSSCKIFGYQQYSEINWLKILQQIRCSNTNAVTSVVHIIFQNQFSHSSNSENEPNLEVIKNAITICIKKTDKTCVFQQNQYYFNLISIINQQFFSFKHNNYNNNNNNNNHNNNNNNNDNKNFNLFQNKTKIKQILKAYNISIKKVLAKTIACILQDQDNQDHLGVQSTQNQNEKYNENSKRYSILESILKSLSFQQLKQLLRSEDKDKGQSESQFQFSLNMLEYALIIPSIVEVNKYVNQVCLMGACRQIQRILNQENQVFQKKRYVISITFKYIAKFALTIPIQFLLQICNYADETAIKYQPLADACYQIMEILTPQLLSIQSYKLFDFLCHSLGNVNQNIWGHNAQSYLFVFKLLFHLDQQYWLNISQYLNQNLVIMIQILAEMLNSDYNHEVMQKLLELLNIFINNDNNSQILQRTSEQDLKIIAKLVFNYEELDSNASSFFYYQCSKNQFYTGFINSMNQEQFWKTCEVDKLQFYVDVYLKFASSGQKYYNLSEQCKLVQSLRKNIWQKFIKIQSLQEKSILSNLFYNYKDYFKELIVQYERIYTRGSRMFNSNDFYDFNNFNYSRVENMEIQVTKFQSK